jgi:hypothetical protein
MSTNISHAIDEVKAGMANASELMRRATTRIQELESCLNRMVHNYENTLSDSEGRFPHADSGCIDCTAGTVPDKYNTGPCAYHTAKRLLAQL